MSQRTLNESSIGSSPPTTGEVSQRSVVDLLQGLRQGTITGATLSSHDRRACVAYLMAEGYSVAESAKICQTCDRTITRDRAKIRQENAIQRDPSFEPQMVGGLVHDAEGAIGRLRRIARDKTVSAAVRVEAEKQAWIIRCDLIKILQSLGHLPIATQHLRADLTHHVGELPDLQTIELEIRELIQVEQDFGGADDGLQAKMHRLEATTKLLGVAEEAQEAQEAQQTLDQDKDSRDDQET